MVLGEEYQFRKANKKVINIDRLWSLKLKNKQAIG